MTAVLFSKNTTIGSFRLRGHRGGGGFSDVYEATDHNGARIAVKVLRASPGDVDSVSARFRRECELLERLDSRRVARIISSNLDGPTPWIASEFIDGPNIREAISERGCLDRDGAIALTATLSAVIRDIHEAGIAHRDLSPNNVLLGSNGPVVIDFGSARMELGGQAGSVLSIGTPFYASPEMVSGAMSSFPADLYSLARVIQFALTGAEETRWSFVDELGNDEIWRKLDQCLESDPKSRPSALEISRCAPEGPIPKVLTALNYRQERINKLPRRFSPKTVIVSLSAVAMIAVGGTYLVARRAEVPLTVDRLLAVHPASDVTIETTSYPVKRGWISAIPGYSDLNVQYTAPENLSNDLRTETLDAYKLFNSSDQPDDIANIQISSEVLRDQLLLTLNEVGSIDLAISKHPVIRSLLQDVIESRSNLIPWSCTLEIADFLKKEGTENNVSYMAAALSNPECLDVTGKPWTTFIGYKFFPKLNGAVLTVAQGHRHMIDIRGLLANTRIQDASILKPFPVEFASLVGVSSEDFRAPLNGFASRYEDPYLKRAWELPAGRTLLLTLPDGDSRIADISMFAIGNWIRDEWSGGLSDVFTPLGSLSSIKGGSKFRIPNPTDTNWIVVFEVEDRFGDTSNIDFTLSDGGEVTSQDRLKTLEDFAVDAKEFKNEIPSSGYYIGGLDVSTKFQLPEVVPGFASSAPLTDTVVVGGVTVPVPRAWFQFPVSGDSGAKFPAVNRNPIWPWDVDGLEVDVPHIEIFETTVASVSTHLGGEAWLATNRYKNCYGSRSYSENNGIVFFEYRIFLMCAVPSSLADGDNPRLRLQRAPIVEFQLSTKFDDPAWTVPWSQEVFRGRFVPRFDIDLQFWEEFVKQVESQFSAIDQRERLKCLQTYSFWEKHCLRPAKE